MKKKLIGILAAATLGVAAVAQVITGGTTAPQIDLTPYATNAAMGSALGSRDTAISQAQTTANTAVTNAAAAQTTANAAAPASALATTNSTLATVQATANAAATAASLTTTNTNVAALQTAAACKWSYVAGSNVTIANTTVETSIASTPQQGSLTIPACATGSAFEVQIHVDGVYQAATVAPGSLTQYIKFNGVKVCSVVLGNLATTGASNLGAHGNAYLRVDASGNVKCTGFLGYQITATGEAPGYWSTVGTPTITMGTAQTIDYTGAWSTANASNSITSTSVIGSIQR